MFLYFKPASKHQSTIFFVSFFLWKPRLVGMPGVLHCMMLRKCYYPSIIPLTLPCVLFLQPYFSIYKLWKKLSFNWTEWTLLGSQFQFVLTQNLWTQKLNSKLESNFCTVFVCITLRHCSSSLNKWSLIEMVWSLSNNILDFISVVRADKMNPLLKYKACCGGKYQCYITYHPSLWLKSGTTNITNP